MKLKSRRKLRRAGPWSRRLGRSKRSAKHKTRPRIRTEVQTVTAHPQVDSVTSIRWNF